jgi:hypothetical protein
MSELQRTIELAQFLIENHPNFVLTRVDALVVAAQIRRNEILIEALVLDTPNNEPGALEAIVIALQK